MSSYKINIGKVARCKSNANKATSGKSIFCQVKMKVLKDTLTNLLDNNIKLNRVELNYV